MRAERSRSTGPHSERSSTEAPRNGMRLPGRSRPLIEGVGLAIGKHGGVATASGVVLVESPALRASLSID
jgi:hypothetical protein